MKAFYFATEERRLRYGDDRKIIVGKSHSVKCDPIPCQQGLHASIKIIDALQYAPGPILYLVEVSGKVAQTDDKICGKKRHYLAEFDASDLLFKFACDCALVNVELIRPYTKDFDLIVDFLNNPSKDAARAAAYAARAAAADAAADAAYAARAAADAAADAAYAAADAAYAARAAADAAADAAYAADQNNLLTQRVREATGWDI